MDGYQQGLSDQSSRRDGEKAGEGAGFIIGIAVFAIVLAIVFPVASLVAVTSFVAVGEAITQVTPMLFPNPGYVRVGIYPVQTMMSWPGAIAGSIAGLIGAFYGYRLECRLAESGFYYIIRHIWRVLTFTLAATFALGVAFDRHYITQLAVFVGIGLSLLLFHAIFWYLVPRNND